MGTGFQSLKFRITTLLFRSGNRLVDLDWYRSQNLNGSFWRPLAALHYLLFNGRQLARLHPLFSPEYFIEQCKQQGLESPLHPLKSYLSNSAYWQVNTHPLFDTAFYAAQAGENLNQPPLTHYLDGGHLLHNPHPLFLRNSYLEHFPTLKNSTIHCPLSHYVKMGYRDMPETHPLFQQKYYAEKTGIPLTDGQPKQDLLLHFLDSQPRSESCHPLFYPAYFIKHCQWLGLAIPHSPLIAYLQNPEYWQVNTHPLFDASHYIRRVGSNLDQPPLLHFLDGGHRQHDSHMLFQRSWYEKSYPALKNMPNQCALVHYLSMGYRDMPETHPLFQARYYGEKTGITVTDNKSSKDLLLHFVTTASPEIACHPVFSPDYFINQCQRLGLAIPKNPLKTYLRNPAYWNVDTHPLFDANYYAGQIGYTLKQPPLLHYISGGHLQYNPHPLFLRDWYLRSFSKLQKLPGHCTLVHYLKQGYRQMPSTHPLFHARYYAEQAGISVINNRCEHDALLHFLKFSSKAAACHPVFSPDYFIKQCQQRGLVIPYQPLKAYLSDLTYWHVSTHPLFDAEYYLQQIGDDLSQPPLLHYISGGHQLYDPHPLFLRESYFSSFPDLSNMPQLCPLVHFLKKGYRSMPSTHPLFHNKYYAEQAGIPFEHQKTDRNGLLHFLREKSNQYSCHPIFSNEYFMEQCQKNSLPIPDLPLQAYLGNPHYWKIDTHPLFNAEFYLGKQTEALQQPPLLHYVSGGHLQNDPHPLFQRSWYLKKFPRLAKATSHCALIHYLIMGYRHMPSTHPLFHARYYAEQAGIPFENEKTEQDTLQHFVKSTDITSCHPLFSIQHFMNKINKEIKNSAHEIIINEYLENKNNWKYGTHILFNSHHYLSQGNHGVQKIPPLVEYISETFFSRNPHPVFDTSWYLGRNLFLNDLNGQNKVPLTHFVTIGHKMGESPHPLFALHWYRQTYMQGIVNDTNPLIEFLLTGEKSGNRPNPLYPEKWKEVLWNEHHCKNLEDFARSKDYVQPIQRNRISDNFSTPKIANKPAQDISTNPINTIFSKINENESGNIKSYFILFTARSGSSWLTELIGDRKILGQPGEWFNPDLMQSTMNSFNKSCNNIHEYCSMLQSSKASAEGYFGAELTAKHLSLLGELIDVYATFKSPTILLHLRKNIVAQAISLFLATETGYFHASNTANKNKEATYSETKIKKWIEEILNDEKYFYNFINEKNADCHLTWYEDLQSDSDTCVSKITSYISGIRATDKTTNENVNKKIGSSINIFFEEKFRKENTYFIDYINHERPFKHIIETEYFSFQGPDKYSLSTTIH